MWTADKPPTSSAETDQIESDGCSKTDAGWKDFQCSSSVCCGIGVLERTNVLSVPFSIRPVRERLMISCFSLACPRINRDCCMRPLITSIAFVLLMVEPRYHSTRVHCAEAHGSLPVRTRCLLLTLRPSRQAARSHSPAMALYYLRCIGLGPSLRQTCIWLRFGATRIRAKAEVWLAAASRVELDGANTTLVTLATA